VENCTVKNCGSQGILAEIVTNCSVLNSLNTGITAREISHSSATSVQAAGISSSGSVSHSFAQSATATALLCTGNVSNSVGTSFGTQPNNVGIFASGTASFCRGSRDGGVAISATIAIGCTVNGTGTVSSSQKHLGTP
jgi:hypothetical protein